ncbi:molecular chaperone [Enterobacter sp. CGMCC 5087]|uniref:fimbrial biogenesis chaperone n=1 Tax=Enterobacter sp. CGMCC 5087 TaxID=2183878 RepID=UPI0015E7F975|nr:molecular chaperone [Enterobacter sp. CGMCC 5087]
MKKMAFALACLCTSFLGAGSAFAGLQLGGTRLIYPAHQKSVTITVLNQGGGLPYLIQPRVLRGLNGPGGAPFVVTPQLFRLESDGESAVRVVKLPANLPSDRESLFWLSVLAIPAGDTPPDAKMDNATLSKISGKGVIGLGQKIKLIYRPDGLPGLSASGGKLKVSRSSQGVKLENPTPFIISLASLDVGGHAILTKRLTVESTTLLPFSSEDIPFSGLTWPADIKWQTINDGGGLESWKGGRS